MFSDPIFIKSFKVTAILTTLGIVVQTPISMLLGVWAAGNQRNRAVLSVLYFIPLLLSAAAISVVWASFSTLTSVFPMSCTGSSVARCSITATCSAVPRPRSAC